jgi:hypothetical protein
MPSEYSHRVRFISRDLTGLRKSRKPSRFDSIRKTWFIFQRHAGCRARKGKSARHRSIHPTPRENIMRFAPLFGLLLWLGATGVALADEFAERRQRLNADIAALARQTAVETGRREFDARVMAALDRTPRHRFVPAAQVPYAYDNRPLPIGHGQTISQPYIVALMTDLIQPQPEHKVLEIGTGSGYQAAVLAELVEQVYTIEIIEPLAVQATKVLEALDYANVQTRVGDGYYGWEDAATLRRHHGHRRRQPRPAAADRPTQTRRAHGDPGGRAVPDPTSAAGGKTGGWEPDDPADSAGALRAADRRTVLTGSPACGRRE